MTITLTLYKKIFNDIVDYFFGTNCFSFHNLDDKNLYPINLEFTLLENKTYYKWIDKSGIPFKYYNSVGKQYNPTRIATYGLANYNYWILKKNNKAKEKFLKVAKWFLNSKNARYYYHFDWMSLKAPWISCLAQGVAVSVLIRGFRITKKKKYLLKARKALEPFFKPISRYGLQSKINNKFIFLEEYPVDMPTHVLNGFLSAFIGLIEYCDIIKNEKKVLNLKDKLIYTLEKNIIKWSKNNWSTYQILKEKGSFNYCTPKYHNLHISQLMYISHKLKLNNLKPTIWHWNKGAHSLNIRIQALIGKIIFRLKNKAQR